MNYLRQIIFDLRHHKLMSWLSIVGTSIAIFLIMSDYMINNIDNVSVSPESNRNRIVYGYGGEIQQTNGSGSSCLSYYLAKELYEGLDGVEIVSFSSGSPLKNNISVRNGVPHSGEIRRVDENYWKIYDFTFEEGEPFSQEDIESGVNNVIISHSTAEKFFGKQNSYIGREIIIDNRPWIVSGVVKDVNPLFDLSYADGYISHVASGMPESVWYDYLGDYVPILLLNKGVPLSHIKKQISDRYKLFNIQHKSQKIELVYHEQPWTLEERHAGYTNAYIDLTSKHRMKLIGYVVLLLIPAINLSSMTRSRMRHRVSEIGLRRAFGCTRSRLVFDLLTENLILTIIGGLIGLLLSYIFIVVFSNYFVAYGGFFANSIEMLNARPTFEMLFAWESFAAVMLFCLLLNILSAGIPAIKAAFINPAEAINGQSAHK
ncbi:MAG: ABC transporter permease [Muribaculaceae bacterium]|nr:ABC transporter permease [Muribaculaceae bacterium]